MLPVSIPLPPWVQIPRPAAAQSFPKQPIMVGRAFQNPLCPARARTHTHTPLPLMDGESLLETAP